MHVPAMGCLLILPYRGSRQRGANLGCPILTDFFNPLPNLPQRLSGYNDQQALDFQFFSCYSVLSNTRNYLVRASSSGDCKTISVPRNERRNGSPPYMWSYRYPSSNTFLSTSATLSLLLSNTANKCLHLTPLSLEPWLSDPVPLPGLLYAPILDVSLSRKPLMNICQFAARRDLTASLCPRDA